MQQAERHLRWRRRRRWRGQGADGAVGRGKGPPDHAHGDAAGRGDQRAGPGAVRTEQRDVAAARQFRQDARVVVAGHRQDGDAGPRQDPQAVGPVRWRLRTGRCRRARRRRPGPRRPPPDAPLLRRSGARRCPAPGPPAGAGARPPGPPARASAGDRGACRRQKGSWCRARTRGSLPGARGAPTTGSADRNGQYGGRGAASKVRRARSGGPIRAA